MNQSVKFLPLVLETRAFATTQWASIVLRFRPWGWCALLGIASTPALAELRFEVGVQYLLPNQAGQTVDFFIANTDSAPVVVGGLDIFLQVADGGPSAGGVIAGPSISNVNLLTGPLWTAANAQQGSDERNTPQRHFSAVMINSIEPPFPTLAASSSTRVGQATIDTTGFSQGTWDLSLQSEYSQSGLSGPKGEIIGLTLGNGTIAIVPEPGELALLVGGGGLLFALLRKRA